MSNRPDRPRVLFVGGAGHHFLRTIVERPEDGLFVADPDDPGSAEAKAERLGFAVFSGDIDEAVEAHRPDVANVGTVYGRAWAASERLLKLGIPVVSDKPVAATPEQLDRLLNAGGRLVTEFDWRADASLQVARQAVRDGRIGDVVLARAQKTYKLGRRPAWYADPELYTSTMLWINSHGIDALRFVCGEMTPVFARQTNAASPSITPGEDHAVAVYALPNGATAIAHADFARAAGHDSHGDDHLVVRGSKGELVVTRETCVLTTHDASPVALPLPELPTLGDQLLNAVLRHETDVFATHETFATAELLLSTTQLSR
ncbi:MAG: Gfo/Idh/MocA family oxidoreductase [Planctomycetota bacterium]